MVVVYTVAFTNILNVARTVSPSIVLLGLLAWTYFASRGDVDRSDRGNGGLVKSVCSRA